MQVPLYNQVGDEIDKIELRDDIFGIQPNKAVMHQAYLRQLANVRRARMTQKHAAKFAAVAKSRGSKRAPDVHARVRPARRIGKVAA